MECVLHDCTKEKGVLATNKDRKFELLVIIGMVHWEPEEMREREEVDTLGIKNITAYTVFHTIRLDFLDIWLIISRTMHAISTHNTSK